MNESAWQRWLRHPQSFALRRAFFQVHLWSGISLGLYILFMSVTGSVLEYSNELFFAATPDPIVSKSSAPRLTDEQLSRAAEAAWPGFRVMKIARAINPDEAVDIWLRHGEENRHRLFDPRTGSDVGGSVSTGVWLISRLIDLHDNLGAGSTGRKVNFGGAIALLLLAATGIVVWWPGIRKWGRSVRVPRGARGRRLIWHLHSMAGFWSFAFLVVFGASAAYLSLPQPFQDLVDRIEPPNLATTDLRIGDRVLYWLAFLHFGRINGIGIPCGGPGVCDQATKAVWAIFGLAPAVMFVTGAVLWWTRAKKRE